MSESKPPNPIAAMFPPAPEPPTVLGRHRILGPKAGVKVSPLCLGAMSFGEAWKAMMGECSKQTAFEMMDFFHESGGNFIDTANNYQGEESETWIGEWMEKRGVRDEIVIATKFTTGYRAMNPGKLKSNYCGNSAKSLRLSVNDSLKKLRTDYIDLLYIHWWDFTTSVEELMQSLNRLVDQGKVLYLGVSDTPAWIVSKANQYARDHGLAQFAVYQGLWSASERDLEQEIVPMCQDEGMAICPWGALGRGKFKTEEQRNSGEGRQGEMTEGERKVSVVLEKIAKAHNTGMTSVAMAYVMHTAPNVYPIVGGRKVEHLKGNIEALKLKLSSDELREIEQAYGYQYTFPAKFLFAGEEPSNRLTARDVALTRTNVQLDIVGGQSPAFPPQSK